MSALARFGQPASAFAAAAAAGTVAVLLRAVALLLSATAAGVSAQPAALIDADGARAAYHSFLDLAPAGDPRRADALRRLADLELERAEALLAEGGAEASAAAYDTAIALYDELLAEHPDRANGDVVLYQLARAHDGRGHAPAAVEALTRLVREYPDSTFADEAWFRCGEAYFLRRDFDLASDAYARVMAFGESTPFYEQALYKHGWSRFREARYEDGLASFWALVARMLLEAGVYASGREDALSRAERELLDDSLRAMSVSFSYMDGVASLDAFLDDQGAASGYEHLLYAGLGDLYLSQERYNDAAAAYESFSAAYPSHREAPALLLRVVETYETAGFPAEVLAAKEAFAERFALTEPFWELHAPADLPAVVAALKTHLTDLTEYYHARAQSHELAADAQTPAAGAGAEAAAGEAGPTDTAAARAEDYATATYWYRRWLASFPGAPETPGKRFLLAELLFEQGQYADATAEYARTAYDYGSHPRAAEAGYAALLAYDAHAATLTDAGARDVWRRQGIDSALRFAEVFPQHAQAGAVLTRAAEDLFDFGEYEAASAAAVRVTSLEPAVSVDLGRTAWTVLGHAQFELGDYLMAERAYQQVLALELPPARREAIVERLAASVYRQGEAHRDAGELALAVDDFQRVAAVAPEAAIAATADYDAAAALVQLERWDRAADTLTRFRERYPDHELGGDVTRKLAAAYLATGDAARAADELATVARTVAEPMPVRIDAAWQAAEQYERAEQPVAAVALYDLLAGTLPVPLDERVDALERIAALQGDLGERRARSATLARIVEVDRVAGAERSDRSRSAAAAASLTLADEERERFAAVRLRQPLAQSLNRKQSAMRRALDAYAQAADYGIAGVTTASAYRVADLYLALGEALMDSERPADLDELALAQYELLLEEQAFPFEEQGISLHERNAARTVDGVYDEWVRASFERLAQLVPARYAKLEKGGERVTYLE